MASTALLQFLSHPKLLKPLLNHTYGIQSESLIHRFSRPKQLIMKCTSNPAPPSDEIDFPDPQPLISEPGTEEENQQPDRFEIEKRRKFQMLQDVKSQKGLVKPEPKNFEIGWKRTKEIKLEKPKGYVIADFLEKLEGLMERGGVLLSGGGGGSKELLAKTGEIVAERAREEAEVLREEGEVEERMITELYRVLKLMEMDLAMVKASVKEETLKERLEQAKARCRQAILVANSL